MQLLIVKVQRPKTNAGGSCGLHHVATRNPDNFVEIVFSNLSLLRRNFHSVLLHFMFVYLSLYFEKRPLALQRISTGRVRKIGRRRPTMDYFLATAFAVFRLDKNPATNLSKPNQ